jgi:hypothetical protein
LDGVEVGIKLEVDDKAGVVDSVVYAERLGLVVLERRQHVLPALLKEERYIVL